jgi:hypothetical protein
LDLALDGTCVQAWPIGGNPPVSGHGQGISDVDACGKFKIKGGRGKKLHFAAYRTQGVPPRRRGKQTDCLLSWTSN